MLNPEKYNEACNIFELAIMACQAQGITPAEAAAALAYTTGVVIGSVARPGNIEEAIDSLAVAAEAAANTVAEKLRGQA